MWDQLDLFCVCDALVVTYTGTGTRSVKIVTGIPNFGPQLSQFCQRRALSTWAHTSVVWICRAGFFHPFRIRLGTKSSTNKI